MIIHHKTPQHPLKMLFSLKLVPNQRIIIFKTPYILLYYLYKLTIPQPLQNRRNEHETQKRFLKELHQRKDLSI